MSLLPYLLADGAVLVWAGKYLVYIVLFFIKICLCCDRICLNFRKLSLASHLTTQHGVFHSHLLAGVNVCQPPGEKKAVGTPSPR